IHGLNGNSMRSSSSNQDNSPMVDIQVLPRVMNLKEVEDDMQSLYINSATDTFEFRASTQDNSGKVEGIIRYHPFLYDRETYPQDPDADEGKQAVKRYILLSDIRKRSIFDFFWNGRLIPKNGYFQFDWCTPKGSKPPAECYNRFSGALFTNDAFKVTTNKMSFVDLELTLKNKNIIFTRVENGKVDFTDWLQTCHDKHDKQIKFVDYQGTIKREDLPKKMQDSWEIFSSIEWDGRIYKTGQLVSLCSLFFCVKNVYIMIILGFCIDAFILPHTGEVSENRVQSEPKALHDKNKIIPISKIDKTATEEAILKHIESDSAKKMVLVFLFVNLIIHDYTSNAPISASKLAKIFSFAECLTELGKYTLTLSSMIQESRMTVIGDKELPSYKLSFSITEGIAQKFVIGASMSPTIHIGVPFDIPLQIKDAYDHSTPPPPDLKPVLTCRSVTQTFTVTYDLNVTLPGLKEDTLMIKISPLPGNPHSLHVKPEDEPITVENGHTVKFNVEVHDEAGNITASPKQIVRCKVDGLPFKATDCSTGVGQLETEPINLKIIHGEPQMLKAEFVMPSKKNIATVVRELKVVPSRRVLRMELGSVDDENLVLKNNEKIEWLAGSSLENLFFKLFDEAGREVSLSPEIASKIKVTWTADENLEDLLQGRLPDLQVPTQAHREQRYQVSYQDQSVSFSFYIIPHPDEPSKMKATLPTKNPVKLGETMSGISDSSSVLVTGVRFQSGSLGARELCFTYMSFEVRVIVKMTNGDPAKLELVSGPEMVREYVLLRGERGGGGPNIDDVITSCLWGNPCPDQRVSKMNHVMSTFPIHAHLSLAGVLLPCCSTRGYYQLEFIGSFNKKPIPGPSVNLAVIPDPHKPVRLSVRYDTAAKFAAGGKFPAFAVTVESEEGSPMTTFNPAAASMLLQNGASSGGIPPPTMKIKVEANQPVRLGPKSQPTPPVVSYSKDISSRTLVQNLTLFVMVRLYQSLLNVGHLAFISDDSEARVISWHLRGDMRCVVTKTREAAQRIHRDTHGQQEVLPLTSLYLITLLPHLRNGRLLFEPRGNPKFARELLTFPSAASFAVFKNFLANTILIDDLDSGNHYREMVVQGGSQCPTILTRQGDRISGKGKFGGSQNSAPSNMPDVFGAPIPQEYFTLKEQIGDLLRQYGIVVQKRDEAEKDYQDLLNKQKSPEALKQKQEMDEKIKELDEINRHIGKFVHGSKGIKYYFC
uniref:Structural maintenance of chromosomes flexible hinge domain containing 1 n=1 Tax=Labrus bergylta TaxID=56723 RepID=A0A3Q3GMN4_9LABR